MLCSMILGIDSHKSNGLILFNKTENRYTLSNPKLDNLLKLIYSSLI